MNKNTFSPNYMLKFEPIYAVLETQEHRA